MKYSQKYTLIQAFQQVDENQSFPMSDWPLHITLADVFSVTITPKLMQDIQQYIDSRPTATSHVQSAGVLGATDVWLLEATPELYIIHLTLIDILEDHGAVFNNPDFIRSGFIPHITKQAEAGMKQGDKVIINITTLVDMFPDQDWQMRKMIRHFTPE